MKIDDELITYLETLSRLELTDVEKQAAKAQLSDILGYFNRLEELDTEGVEALFHPSPSVNAFREDEACPSFERPLLLENAPQQRNGCFKAPKTVE